MNRTELVEQLFESMDAVKRGMAEHMRQLQYDCPISRSQVELLFAIRHMQPVSFKLLAQHLYLTPGAISQLAEGLEQHALISRHADDHDRRIQCLQVSKKGGRLLDAIEKRRYSYLTAIMEGLSDEELAVLLQVHEKIREHFQQLNIQQQTKKEIV